MCTRSGIIKFHVYNPISVVIYLNQKIRSPYSWILNGTMSQGKKERSLSELHTLEVVFQVHGGSNNCEYNF